MADDTCKIPGCDKLRKANGWCSMHYQRWFRHGDPLKNLYLQPPKTCSVDGCDDMAMGRGWCSRHWQRWKRHGDPLGGGPSKAELSTNLGCTCSVEDCGNQAKARGYCSTHYGRWLRHGTTDEPNRKKPTVPCSIEGCDAPSETRGWCDKHYQRWRIHGDPTISLVAEITDTCSQAGCSRRLAKAGVCWKHYRYFKAKFMAEQDGKCFICHVPAEQAPRKILLLDHDHATGQPRSLLCAHCNWGLGHFMDNPALMRAAARYVEEMKPGQMSLFAA